MEIIKNKISVEQAKEVIDSYMKTSKERPMFSGLLLSIDMNWNEYRELTGDGKRILDMFKFDLEVQMEKLLRYQNDLPRDKFNKSLIDLKYIEVLLKKSNPEFWGDISKKLEMKSAVIANKNEYSITNESGFSLIATEIKSNT